MQFFGKTPVMTLLGLCALGLAAARPAAAQNLIYTLSGVTFGDGATATGYFDFNPTTLTSNGFDIVTTNGVTDALTGAEYKPSATPPGVISPLDTGNYAFKFQVNNGFNTLVLNTFSAITGPNVYTLTPGFNVGSNGLGASGELTPVYMNGLPTGTVPRLLTAGSLIVTDANPVPEASTTVSFSLLLALGLGGAAVAARRKKAAA